MREESSCVADRNPLAAVAHGHTLAEAIVDSVREPLVVLDRDLRVIAASRSFYRTFAVEPRNTQGRKLYLLGDGQWNIPALRTVLEDVIPKHRTVEAYEVEHEFPTIGRRVMLREGDHMWLGGGLRPHPAAAASTCRPGTAEAFIVHRGVTATKQVTPGFRGG